MRKANAREINTLRNYLANHTTGAIRRNLSYWSINDLGYLDKGYITRIRNIYSNTDALERIKATCLWY